MRDKLQASIKMDFEIDRMEPLFASQQEYDVFNERQSRYNVKTAPLDTYSGNCYLGIDAGSTTTKAALVGEDGSLLYSFYSNNNGNPLATSIKAIQEIYSQLPAGVKIAYSCSTGYGEALIKAALLLDEGEVETVSHLSLIHIYPLEYLPEPVPVFRFLQLQKPVEWSLPAL